MVEIIAHRGASRDALENTLEAFTLALEQGADGIELDVHATADGVVVVHHDPIVRTVTGRVVIARTPFAELPAIGPEGRQRIPSLEDTLALVGDRATVYVEVKAPRIERELRDVLDRFPESRTAVHAFDHRVPLALRGLRPQTPIGLLSASYPLALGAEIERALAQAWWQNVDLVDEAMVREAHTHGTRVIVWTVDDIERARELVGMGVDALCTNVPGRMRAALLGG